ncbi:hypothetical protein FNF31_07168 [Cafeteria roenbergensis]|uniref:EGF-like domain-containing protein n=1 Tax=Cafeteria roenbergensis TaxID=33653 RepID=A0A5A8C9A4_CAFRO|nr:hypothetical protein FNF31_07168 [Cafeteria roenbergensis]
MRKAGTSTSDVDAARHGIAELDDDDDDDDDDGVDVDHAGRGEAAAGSAAGDGPTGNSCQLPGCKSWSQGAFPRLKQAPNGSLVPATNGGVPQRANLSLHLGELARTVVDWIPDPDYEGNAVFDFEDWTPIFDANDGSSLHWHGVAYQEYSKQLVRAEHPAWPESKVEAQARAEFEAAAIEMFAKTLTTVRALRPRAKWGFYGFPANPYMPCTAGDQPQCGYNNPAAGAQLRAQNDAIQAVFNASTGLFPSVYLPPSPGNWPGKQFEFVNAQYVAAVTAEAVRLATVAGRSAVVRPYAWAFYHNGTTTLSAPDTRSVAGLAYSPPLGDGLVLWGDAEAMHTQPLMTAWMTNVGGPALQAVQAEQCACSRSQCSGHGACVSGPDHAAGCDCFPGYHGGDCSSATGPSGE